MTDEEAIEDLVATLDKFRPGKPLRNYIAYAVFPKFKHIEPGTRVDFPFPLTALVGPNGSGKSSLLHALYGMPARSSTMRFWFATALDPIVGPRKDPQRYFYGHWNESFKGIVETRKARLGSKADYWEPYRLSVADGMEPLPQGNFEGKTEDRWNPVRRKLTYVNLKATIGSFDRYFHFDDFESNDELRAAMQREAKRLHRIKTSNRQSYILGNEKLFENRDLNMEELSAVCAVLGRKYDSARLIRHSLYLGSRGKDLSVVFRRGREYSEAFAGSGELAAVRVVTDVLSAEEFSLILLDEPETSLHPGAQRALLRFLMEQIKLKKHQVVLSTHSRDFLEGLPQGAIKVFEDNGKGLARVLPKSTPAAALMRLGRVPADKTRVLVEDEIARLLVLHAAKNLDPGDAARLEVKLSPGGWSHMLAYSGPSHMTSGQPVYMYLDGDQRRVAQFTNPDAIAPEKHSTLAKLLQAELGTEPRFSRPGGIANAANEAAATAAMLDYLGWCRKHVAYLPRKRPEEILLTAFKPGPDYSALGKDDCKNAFLELLKDGVDVEPSSSAEILAWAKLKVAKLDPDNEDILSITDQLAAWLDA
ncbi:putative ATPase [Variovorax boronicumulans]|uniref:ATP-dependent nuclease n=1 Tax=Variovorax boronicumulans TaxID=436515 RepID=UPI00277DAE87|nr:ATP-binding protein [Variovorax boronicumulans]MDQ0080989.1 putative ATPase [Variovorax boronicumulans]